MLRLTTELVYELGALGGFPSSETTPPHLPSPGDTYPQSMAPWSCIDIIAMHYSKFRMFLVPFTFILRKCNQCLFWHLNIILNFAVAPKGYASGSESIKNKGEVCV